MQHRARPNFRLPAIPSSLPVPAVYAGHGCDAQEARAAQTAEVVNG